MKIESCVPAVDNTPNKVQCPVKFSLVRVIMLFNFYIASFIQKSYWYDLKFYEK